MRVTAFDCRESLCAIHELRHECFALLIDDVPAKREVLLAMLDVLAHERLEIVDVVEINVVELVGLGIDVPWHGDVDQE